MAQLNAAAAAGSRVVVVAGEAGIGKTTLVRHFADGRDVLWGACDDLTVPQPLGPLRDVGVSDGPELLKVLGVCVLEDCHWADEATLDVLAHAARRVGRTSGLLVLTFRDDEFALDHQLRRVVASIPPDDVVRVHLADLGGDDALYEATRTELWLLGDLVAAVGECEQGGLLAIEGDAVRCRHELARRAYRSRCGRCAGSSSTGKCCAGSSSAASGRRGSSTTPRPHRTTRRWPATRSSPPATRSPRARTARRSGCSPARSRTSGC